MANLEVKNGVLNIEGDFSFSKENPLFDSENVDRQYSFPFKIALNDASKTVLKNVHRLDNVRNSNRMKAILRQKSVHTEGVLVLENDDDDETIEGTFQGEAQRVFEVLDTIQIHDILETVQVPQSIVPHLYLNVNNYNASTYAITINDVTYSVNTSQTGFGSRLTEMQNLRDAILTDYPTLQIQVGASNINITNSAYLTLKIEGYVAGLTAVSFANVNEARADNFAAFLQNNYNNYQNAAIVFPAFACENPYAENTPSGFTPFINRIHRQNSNINVYMPAFAEDAKTISEYTFVPFLKVQYVLNRIGIAIGRNIEFDCGNFTNDFESLLIFNNKTLDIVPRADWYVDTFSDNTGIATAAVQKFYNHFQTQIVLSNHVQKITAKAFLQMIANAFCLKIDVTDSAIYLRLKRAINLNIPQNLTFVPLNTARKRVTKGGIKISHTVNNDDAKSKSFADYETLQGLNKVQLPFYTLPDYLMLGAYEMPNTEGGLHSVQSSSRGAYGWAFLIDRGEAEGTNGGVFYRKCSFKGAAFWLSITGANGLYAKLFANIIEYIEADTVEIVAQVSDSVVANVLDFKRSNVFIHTQRGAIEGIIKSVSVTELQADFLIKIDIKSL